MAEMIPDKLPRRASAGEKKLFSVLQHLPEEDIVYYESLVDDRYPDFLLICPSLGLLVIEVKGWRLGDILAADAQTIKVREFGKEVDHPHPFTQARDYWMSLVSHCQEDVLGKRLLQKDDHGNALFLFPFGHVVVFPYMTSEQLQDHPHMGPVFPLQRVVTRDQLEQWQDDGFTPDRLTGAIKSYFDPFWEIKPLTLMQTKILRAIAHPEIRIQGQADQPTSDQSQEPQEGDDDLVDLKILDLKQEQNARHIGSGHRIIYGVAGSGKTILLVARAKLLSKQDPRSRILVLCYNVTLSAYLRSVLADCANNVFVFHFDGWAKHNSTSRKREESDQALGERLLTTLQNGKAADSRCYDAVLVDEAQDFEPVWFQCVLEAMREPEDGDLVIVGDGNQSLHRRNKINWKQLGIKAQGRTISAKFDLDKNYRNTRQIMELASVFATTDPEDDEMEDSIRSLQVDPEKCKRSGPKPRLVKAANKTEECKRVLRTLQDLTQGRWFGQSVKPLPPEQIAIFYPRLSRRNEDVFRAFLKKINEAIAPVTWLSDKGNPQSKTKVAEKSIKVQTIHSAKGLQYKAVILLWGDDLPSPFEDADEQVERQLFYVALTRPEDYLVISYSGSSSFIQEIEQSGKADLE
jgi:hypothetical protein